MPYRVLPAIGPLLLRGTSLAILVRLAIGAALYLPPGTNVFTRLAVPTSFAYAAICGVLMLVDAARRRELVLFANLGVSTRMVALSAVIPALLIESLMSLTAPR
jgi:hypothetical protein